MSKTEDRWHKIADEMPACRMNVWVYYLCDDENEIDEPEWRVREAEYDTLHNKPGDWPFGYHDDSNSYWHPYKTVTHWMERPWPDPPEEPAHE